jgi:signal recognition particle GTPase
MPFIIRWPGKIKAGSRYKQLIQNIDYAPTFLEAAGITAPSEVQGKSLLVCSHLLPDVERTCDRVVVMHKGRILQQGDILTLVEKTQSAVDEKEAERLAKKVKSKKGLDLDDFLRSMKQMQKMGPLKNVLGMLPGVSPAMLKQANVSEDRLKHIEAIILSMTPKERSEPTILNGSRRARIARGSGRTVQEVNKLLSQFKQMRKFMKTMGKSGGKMPFGAGFPG